ncbi:MAG TPA: hypothetical protein VKY74_16255 [Chloroflexia bacterium]|nr:hypothetical protein [Chloroflexia bacterium]
MTDQTPPQSPEAQPAGVRRDLQQNMVSHEGGPAALDDKPGNHLGATDEQMTAITAPMHGPGNLVGLSAAGDSRDETEDEELLDPGDEITPG